MGSQVKKTSLPPVHRITLRNLDLFLQPPAQSPKEDQEDHVFLIQTVLDKAMKKDGLVNELFLQLIKQTTDHPEPNSR